MTNFTDMTIDQLTELQTALRSHLKDRRAEAKETEKVNRAKVRDQRDDYGRSVVSAKGQEVTVDYKKTTLTGKVTKIGEKTFTIYAEVDGEWKNVWRYFYQVHQD